MSPLPWANSLLILAILSFVLQSLVVQSVQSTTFYKPFFLLFIAHGAYFLVIPGILCYYRFGPSKDTTLLWLELNKARSILGKSWPELWIRVSVCTIVFTLTSLCWYVSVSKIPIGEISAIYNTSCFFTYILSTIFLKESATFLKTLAVTFSVIGIIVIALGGGQDALPNSQFAYVGYTFSVIASLGAASYEVLYTRLMVPSRDPSLLFSLFVTGMIGVVTIFLGLILFPIFHFTGWETFQLPPLQAWPYILLSASLGVLFNSLFLLVITFLGPVAAATGILVSIPLTSLADWGLIGTSIGWNIIVGSAFIFVGFCLLQSQSTTAGESLDNETTQETSHLLQ
jgi:drug/metabolite transporter (DMT)-like permease